jgi:hypothetical protein
VRQNNSRRPHYTRVYFSGVPPCRECSPDKFLLQKIFFVVNSQQKPSSVSCHRHELFSYPSIPNTHLRRHLLEPYVGLSRTKRRVRQQYPGVSTGRKGQCCRYNRNKLSPQINVQMGDGQEVLDGMGYNRGYGSYPWDAQQWLAAGWLRRWGSERLAFSASKKTSTLTAARVLRIMDNFMALWNTPPPCRFASCPWGSNVSVPSST